MSRSIRKAAVQTMVVPLSASFDVLSNSPRGVRPYTQAWLCRLRGVIQIVSVVGICATLRSRGTRSLEDAVECRLMLGVCFVHQLVHQRQSRLQKAESDAALHSSRVEALRDRFRRIPS